MNEYNYLLHKLTNVKLTNEKFNSLNFDIQEFSKKSFGVYQGEIYDVKLKFAKEIADEVANYNFHPTQKGKYNDEFFRDVIRKLGTTPYNHDICVTPAITPMTLPDLAESYKFCLENNVFNFGYYFLLLDMFQMLS